LKSATEDGYVRHWGRRARICRERPDEVQRHQVGMVILKETTAAIGWGKNTPTDFHQMIAS
jgi:hypothetical protein